MMLWPAGATIGKAAIRYDFALRPKGGVFLISRLVRLPFDSCSLDQSQARRDGPNAEIDGSTPAHTESPRASRYSARIVFTRQDRRDGDGVDLDLCVQQQAGD